MDNETNDAEAEALSPITENISPVERMGSSVSIPENNDDGDAVPVQSSPDLLINCATATDGEVEAEEGPASVPPPPPSPSEPSESNNGEIRRSTSGSVEYTTGAQTRIVTQLIRTIGNLRTENAILEMQISDSDKQNKILQLQIDIMMKKMELLEGFMSQVRQMDEDDTGKEGREREQQPQLCKRCRKRVHAEARSGGPSQPEDIDVSDGEEVDVKDVLRSVGWSLDGDSGDEDGLGEQQRNPLLIDIVVGNVLSYLPPSSVLKCRLVNRLWCQEATYILKHQQTLVINRDNIGNLHKLLELLTSSPGSPLLLFRKVKIDINFLVISYRPILERFFTEFGPEITHFSMHCDQENSSILYTEEVRNIFLPFLTSVHKLELSLPTKITERQTIYDDIRPKSFVFSQLTVLKLRQMDVSLDIGGYSVAVIKELLKTAPNLRSLHVETHTKEVVTRFLIALNDKECRQVTNQLEELYLDAFITEEHLIAMIPLDFKLKTLQLSYFTLDATSLMLEAVLAKHRTTLQTLIIGDYQKRTTTNSLPLVVKLPILRELRHLKFVDPLFPDQRQILFNPLNFLEQMPSLREMSFDHETGKPAGPHYFQDVFACSPSTCDTLTTLRISHGLTEPHLVASASKMFPNLKTLELSGAPDSVIQAVWKEFTGLKTLYLYLNPTNLNIDSLMTGIPDQVCRRIQEKNLFAQVDLMNALDIIRTEAAICNLTELETLRVDGSSSSLITAVSGYLAFCQMKNLANIAIKSDVITLSRECRRVLGETLPLGTLDFF